MGAYCVLGPPQCQGMSINPMGGQAAHRSLRPGLLLVSMKASGQPPEASTVDLTDSKAFGPSILNDAAHFGLAL